MRVSSCSLTWPGALCYDLIPCEAGFVFTDTWEGTVFSHPFKWVKNLRVDMPSSDTLYSEADKALWASSQYVGGPISSEFCKLEIGMGR